MTIDDMRHTAVSVWIASGDSDLPIATYARHTSPAFTKKRYGHLFRDQSGRPSTAGHSHSDVQRPPVADVADVVNLR